MEIQIEWAYLQNLNQLVVLNDILTIQAQAHANCLLIKNDENPSECLASK